MTGIPLLGACAVLCLALAAVAQPDVSFSQSATTVEAYDFVEVTAEVTDAPANPFLEASLSGSFGLAGQDPIAADGFCDAQDGRQYRIRFMPTTPGDYALEVTYRRGEATRSWQGRCSATRGARRGIVRVDPEHPYHFVWEGTKEHYFWNATTTYFLLGWDDETIGQSLDRLHSLGVNRIRVALVGRVEDGRAWFENVFPTERVRLALCPWAAERPDDVRNPGIDVTRFDVGYWRKVDRMLAHARALDMVVSVVFYVDGSRPGTDPFGEGSAGGPDEQRYYRYAAARLAPYSNVMWDLANEYRFFRDNAWAERMGAFLRECDPYDHLTSVHGFGDFSFRTAPWADFAMYQSWDEGGGYDFMLGNRRQQSETARPVPQVNEEYGYEDHYPRGWGGDRVAPARSADNRRRIAWGISMAGCYQTAGERADRGTGWGPDSGGGWLNGRGDDEMILFRGYGWGALEKRRAAKSEEDCGIPPELPFGGEDLGEDQEPWLRLLETGLLPERDPQEEPGQFQIQEEWQALLEESLASGKSDHWLGWLHLGVMRMEAGDSEGAREAWARSLERVVSGWALRNLSVLESRAGNIEAAADLLAHAVSVGPVAPSLVGEYVSLLLKLKRFDDLDNLLRGLPQEVRQAERLRMAAAWVALHIDRFGEVQEALQQEFATIREGELTLSELWFALQEKKLALAEGVEITDELRVRVRRDFPPPYEIDFRMSQEGDDKYVPPQATGG